MVVLGAIAGLCLFFGLFVATEPVVDRYFDSPDVVSFLNFSKKAVGTSETTVYFIGNSLMATAVSAPLRDEELFGVMTDE